MTTNRQTEDVGRRVQRLASIRNLVDLMLNHPALGLPSPMRDTLQEAVTTKRLRIDGNTDFLAKRVELKVSGAERVETTVYVHGVMTYRERIDSAAYVRIVRFGNGHITTETKANAMYNNKWTGLPPGARQKVAEEVLRVVLAEIPFDQYWKLIQTEAAELEVTNQADAWIVDAEQRLGWAARELNKLGQS